MQKIFYSLMCVNFVCTTVPNWFISYVYCWRVYLKVRNKQDALRLIVSTMLKQTRVTHSGQSRGISSCKFLLQGSLLLLFFSNATDKTLNKNTLATAQGKIGMHNLRSPRLSFHFPCKLVCNKKSLGFSLFTSSSCRRSSTAS